MNRKQVKRVWKTRAPKGKKLILPQPIIERCIFDSETGRISAVDLYDEVTGLAYFCEVVETHRKGL